MSHCHQLILRYWLHVDQNYYQGECAPSLLVIEDTGGSVFGALLSTPIRWWQHPQDEWIGDVDPWWQIVHMNRWRHW